MQGLRRLASTPVPVLARAVREFYRTYLLLGPETDEAKDEPPIRVNNPRTYVTFFVLANVMLIQYTGNVQLPVEPIERRYAPGDQIAFLSCTTGAPLADPRWRSEGLQAASLEANHWTWHISGDLERH